MSPIVTPAPIDVRVFVYHAWPKYARPMTPSFNACMASITAGQLRRWLPICTCFL